MFRRKTAKRPQRTGKVGAGATLIAKNTVVTGDVSFDDQLFVNGCIEGNVTAPKDGQAMLAVSDVGTVKGEIRAPFVVINGVVDGDVHGHGRVELAANACVSGNVYYELIEMQLGARVDGQLVHLAADVGEAPNLHTLPGSQPDASDKEAAGSGKGAADGRAQEGQPAAVSRESGTG